MSYAEETRHLNLVNLAYQSEFIIVKEIRNYSTEFKAEAVKKIAENNGNISATAKQLSIAMQTLSNWHNKANQGGRGKLEGTEQYDPQLIAVLEENKRLKRQLKVAEE